MPLDPEDGQQNSVKHHKKHVCVRWKQESVPTESSRVPKYTTKTANDQWLVANPKIPNERRGSTVIRLCAFRYACDTPGHSSQNKFSGVLAGQYLINMVTRSLTGVRGQKNTFGKVWESFWSERRRVFFFWRKKRSEVTQSEAGKNSAKNKI